MKKAPTVQSTIFLTVFMMSPWYGALRWSQLLVMMPKSRLVVVKARRGTCSHDPVQTVSRIPETGNDVPALVEFFVDRAGDDADGDVQVGRVRLKPRDPLGCRQQGDRGDVVSAQIDEVADRCTEGAAGRKHRVEYVALTPGQVIGQSIGVGRGLQRDLVAYHAEEADFGGRQQPHHAVQHAEASAKDRHNQRFGTCQLDAAARGNGLSLIHI